MPHVPAAAPNSRVESGSRALLRIVRLITGVDSAFITSIDSHDRSERALYAVSQGASGATEGQRRDSLDPIFAVPISAGESLFGMLGGASSSKLHLDERQVQGVQMVADALEQLIVLDQEKSIADARADRAERDVVDAHILAHRHASDSAHLERLAYTDALTGLKNRRAFMARWEDELARSSRRDFPIGLMFLDADRFKSVNDAEGHAKGDAVLCAISAALLQVAKSPDVVARLGGDEFALVTTHSDMAQLEALADEIKRLFATFAGELGVTTTLSIGIASSCSCPRNRMLGCADEALYRSKGAGGNTASTFRSSPAPGQAMGARHDALE